MATDSPSPPEPTRKLTYADYAALPDDGNVHQLIEGVLYVTPAPILRHQRISRRLQLPLMHAIELTGLGEVIDAPMDVIFSDDSVVQPDIAVVSTQRSEILDRWIRGAPDLVIEVLSPSTRRIDARLKRDLYAGYGVPRYWIADPETDRIDLYVLEDGAYRLDRSAEAPGTLTVEVLGVPVTFDLTFAFA